MRKPFNYQFGGQSRTVVVEIGHGVEIENATGVGVLVLMDKMRNLRATITECAHVIRVALAANGQHYTLDKVMELAMDGDGIVDLQVTALSIINQLFLKPAADEAKKPAKSKGSSDPLAATR